MELSSSSPFDVLPDELVLLILKFVDVKHTFRDLRLVSKRLKTLTEDDSLWKIDDYSRGTPGLSKFELVTKIPRFSNYSPESPVHHICYRHDDKTTRLLLFKKDFVSQNVIAFQFKIIAKVDRDGKIRQDVDEYHVRGYSKSSYDERTGVEVIDFLVGRDTSYLPKRWTHSGYFINGVVYRYFSPDHMEHIFATYGIVSGSSHIAYCFSPEKMRIQPVEIRGAWSMYSIKSVFPNFENALMFTTHNEKLIVHIVPESGSSERYQVAYYRQLEDDFIGPIINAEDYAFMCEPFPHEWNHHLDVWRFNPPEYW